MSRVDYDKQSAVYDRGRALPSESIAAWMAATARHVGDAVQHILDLGAGTGRFSAPLADTFNAHVVAVEPSAGMREQAACKAHPSVSVIGGQAEHLPLRNAACDVGFLSNMIHHVDDLNATATELRRVVTGPVVLRGALGDRHYDLTLYRFFPETAAIVDTMPTLENILAAFEPAGFTSMRTELVRTLTASSYAEAHEMMKARADTTLELISDEAFERGLERLAEAARVEDGPVFDSLDLVVLR